MFTFVYRRPATVDSVFIYGTDITERKRAERLLAEQAAQIAEMARFPEMNPNPVFRVDREANVELAVRPRNPRNPRSICWSPIANRSSRRSKL